MNENDKGKFLGKLGDLVGKNNRLGKLVSNYGKLREANYISSHFSTYLAPRIATDQSLRENAFKIRHNVYCEELNFEAVKDNGMETDEFDAFSYLCLIQHMASKQYAGTVRLVCPQEHGQFMPIEKYCSDSITDDALNPSGFARHEVCEFSRLAVPKQFRRRKMDDYDGAAVGVINEHTYSETELRCFPFIAIGLYMAAAGVALEKGIQHAYVMMEPRLARSMGFIGIKFKQIGPVVDYHGRRAPYYINQTLFKSNLSSGFKKMLSDIQAKLHDQKSTL